MKREPIAFSKKKAFVKMEQAAMSDSPREEKWGSRDGEIMNGSRAAAHISSLFLLHDRRSKPHLFGQHGRGKSLIEHPTMSDSEARPPPSKKEIAAKRAGNNGRDPQDWERAAAFLSSAKWMK